MSDVNANDTRLIAGIDDVMDTYLGAGHAAMTGVEVELAYFDPTTPGLAPMNVAQNKAVKAETNTLCGGEFARNEPTAEMLEIGSKPGRFGSLKTIIDETNAKIACLSKAASAHGLKRSYFQDLPNQTATQLLQNVVNVERYQAFFAPPRSDMQDIAAYFSVCKSNQVSVSYRDPDHLLDNIRRLYALAPVIFMLTDNGSGFDEGKAFSGHAGMRHRLSLKDKGGYLDYIFTAQNGQEYLRAHIDHVMNNPLFVYYDETGNLIRLPSGTWKSFNDLKDKGLNTATNYYFAESILWPDVKIAALKDSTETVIGHRFEARMIGVGLHQHISALLIVAGLAFDKGFAAKTDALLTEFGFDWSDPDTIKPLLSTAYEAALNHNNQFLAIPFGNNSMQNFATQFADILEDSYTGTDLESACMPILDIMCSGHTDTKINRMLCPTLEDAIALQRDFDETQFENPYQNAAMLLKGAL